MTRRRWWPWWRSPDTSGEAGRHLRLLADRDAHVAELGRELREVQRRNHFSELVAAAITRASEGGTP